MGDNSVEEYEYIVVGSGAGGGPVAANLALAGRSVLVLEAGGIAPPDDYAAEVPAFHTLASEQPDMSWNFYVRHYECETQQKRDSKYCGDRGGVLYPRAGTLGGCTAHNAMILISPSNSDWESIADETGDESWRAANMRRYFERVESCQYAPLKRLLHKLAGWNPGKHGYDGWLATSLPSPKLALVDEVVVEIVEAAALTALVRLPGLIQRLKSFFRSGLDPNDWRAVCAGLEGSRMTPLSTLKGKRVGTRDLLLKVQKQRPDRLTIRTGALATRVVWDGTRACGIEYLEGRHTYRADPQFNASAAKVLRTVRATREVILAGGTFNTPQLLQLSGIGPGGLLREHGIEVRVDLPGVGANLQDRYEVSVVNEMKAPFKLLAGATMLPPVAPEQPDPYLRRWIDSGGGIYTTNGAVISIMKKSTPRRSSPDVLLFGLVTNFYGYFPGYSKVVSSARKYFTWTILKGYSHNTAGRVAIRSKDPQDTPDINFNYFHKRSETADEDLEAVVDAIELARRMTNPYRRRLVEREVVPGDAVETRDQLRAVRPQRSVGAPRLGHLQDRHAYGSHGGGRQQFPRSRHEGAACRRRVGVPAHSGPVHRVSRVHGGGKGQRLDPCRCEERWRGARMSKNVVRTKTRDVVLESPVLHSPVDDSVAKTRRRIFWIVVTAGRGHHRHCS